MAQEILPSSEAEPWWRIGIAPDEAREPPNPVKRGPGYARFIIEYDDQGCSYLRRQMNVLISELDSLAGQRPIILVFVHGWKHNAQALDPNLAAFEKVVAETARAETLATQTPGATSTAKQGARPDQPRPVLGIFVGWRGLSFYFGWLTNITFWNRRTAAQRVALGSVRELFGRLRDYRTRHNNEPVLVIAGHSFGGLIVYSALAQSLIEGAAIGQDGEIETGFADLVLLINPAFEAARYLPIHFIVKRRHFVTGQPPIFVSITAENDWATGLAFPAGAWVASLWEHTRTKKERQALIRTMGHIDWMQTHTVTAEAASPDAASTWTAPAADHILLQERVAPDTQSYEARTPGWTRHFEGGAVLTHTGPDPNTPFWVVTASKEVINGHNGIFGSVFLGFIRRLVADQVR